MKGSPGWDRHQRREFQGISISHISSSSIPSPSIVTARFSSCESGAHLRFDGEGEGGSVLHIDLRTTQLFKLGTLESLCVSEGVGSSEEEEIFCARAVTLGFRTEGEEKAFHCAFKQWKNRMFGACIEVRNVDEQTMKQRENRLAIDVQHWHSINEQVESGRQQTTQIMEAQNEEERQQAVETTEAQSEEEGQQTVETAEAQMEEESQQTMETTKGLREEERQQSVQITEAGKEVESQRRRAIYRQRISKMTDEELEHLRALRRERRQQMSEAQRERERERRRLKYRQRKMNLSEGPEIAQTEAIETMKQRNNRFPFYVQHLHSINEQVQSGRQQATQITEAQNEGERLSVEERQQAVETAEAQREEEGQQYVEISESQMEEERQQTLETTKGRREEVRQRPVQITEAEKEEESQQRRATYKQRISKMTDEQLERLRALRRERRQQMSEAQRERERERRRLKYRQRKMNLSEGPEIAQTEAVEAHEEQGCKYQNLSYRGSGVRRQQSSETWRAQQRERQRRCRLRRSLLKDEQLAMRTKTNEGRKEEAHGEHIAQSTDTERVDERQCQLSTYKQRISMMTDEQVELMRQLRRERRRHMSEAQKEQERARRRLRYRQRKMYTNDGQEMVQENVIEQGEKESGLQNLSYSRSRERKQQSLEMRRAQQRESQRMYRQRRSLLKDEQPMRRSSTTEGKIKEAHGENIAQVTDTRDERQCERSRYRQRISMMSNEQIELMRQLRRERRQRMSEAQKEQEKERRRMRYRQRKMNTDDAQEIALAEMMAAQGEQESGRQILTHIQSGEQKQQSLGTRRAQQREYQRRCRLRRSLLIDEKLATCVEHGHSVTTGNHTRENEADQITSVGDKYLDDRPVDHVNVFSSQGDQDINAT